MKFSPRLVSISIVQDIDSPDKTNTLWLMQYGQFINHDFAFTTFFQTSTLSQSIEYLIGFYLILINYSFTYITGNGDASQWCTDDGQLLENIEIRHPACLPIVIPKDDPFFSKLGRRCMNFVRTTPAPRLDCKFGHAEQVIKDSNSFKDFLHLYHKNKFLTIPIK